MSRSFVAILAAIAIFTAGALSGSGAAKAQDYGAPGDDLAETIFRDIIDRTLEAAAEEIRRSTWGDPAETWPDTWDNPDAADDEYRAWPADASPDTLHRLDKLYARHDRRIAKLEAELDRELRKVERRYQHSIEGEYRPRKIEKRRAKYEARVDREYAKFERKLDDENRHFAEKRDRILDRHYAG